MCSEQTQQELESVQRELQVMMEKRDDALLQMTNAQEQAKQNATALRNLQAVLEEFQRGALWMILRERGGGRGDGGGEVGSRKRRLAAPWGELRAFGSGSPRDL
jgi:hypothetical protein